MKWTLRLKLAKRAGGLAPELLARLLVERRWGLAAQLAKGEDELEGAMLAEVDTLLKTELAFLREMETKFGTRGAANGEKPAGARKPWRNWNNGWVVRWTCLICRPADTCRKKRF